MTDVLRNFLPDSAGDRLMLIIASIVLSVTGYYLFVQVPEIGIDKGAIAIGKIQTDKVVRRRHSGSLRWENISKEGTIYLRDVVYTPKDTWAEFAWSDKMSLRVEPESMVQFDKVNMDQVQIVFVRRSSQGGRCG